MTSSHSTENDKHRSPKDGELNFQTKRILFSLFESKCNMEFQQFHEHSYFYYSRRNCYQFWLSQPILQTSSTSRGRAILAATQEIHEHFCFYYSSRNCYQFLAHSGSFRRSLLGVGALYQRPPTPPQMPQIIVNIDIPTTIFQTRYSDDLLDALQRSPT